MGCASSQSGYLPGTTGTTANSLVDPTPTDTESSTKYPPAEAFEISLNDVDNEHDGKDDSLIKKHPPKRLQKLVEQAVTAVPPTTIEHLEEKLAKAEFRRQQYIQQKIDNIVSLTGKGAHSIGSHCSQDGSGDGDGDENDENNENGVGGDNIENNDQNDEHNDGGNVSVDGGTVIVSSSQDADVQLTSNTVERSANEHRRSDGN